ncbi:MAG TPA: hypothetical protein VGG08_04795 [Solirubrobacteraceae bacterium]|jgi:hypothetical protein
MSATMMVRADLLKLRKRRGTLAWALVLALGPVIVFFAVRAIEHLSNPGQYGPAGGFEAFGDALRLLGVFFGPLAAILIGVEAGTGDHAAGVFRDLVVTGRSRLALFASRLPAAIALMWAITTAGFLLVLIGVYAFASNLMTPDFGKVLDGYGFALLGTGVICAVAVGFSSLSTSKPASITALIGWQLVASPLVVQISALGGARKGLLTQAITHFSPVFVGDRDNLVSMSAVLATIVLVCWLALFVGLGAWRTRNLDA